mmetsp:Transcript_35600/g.85299  ORF Transcript_35600/g.85299 Transcript_35600/m.85299 type:complete len:243 (-) Transcript_35600:616-1344(-)
MAHIILVVRRKVSAITCEICGTQSATNTPCRSSSSRFCLLLSSSPVVAKTGRPTAEATAASAGEAKASDVSLILDSFAPVFRAFDGALGFSTFACFDAFGAALGLAFAFAELLAAVNLAGAVARRFFTGSTESSSASAARGGAALSSALLASRFLFPALALASAFAVGLALASAFADDLAFAFALAFGLGASGTGSRPGGPPRSAGKGLCQVAVELFLARLFAAVRFTGGFGQLSHTASSAA